MKYEIIKPGVCRHNRVLYKTGDTFESAEVNLDKKWPNRFKALSEDERPTGRKAGRRKASVQGSVDTEKTSEGSLELKPRGGGYYDVINTVSGKKLNEKALKKEDAHGLVEGKANDAEAEETTPDED